VGYVAGMEDLKNVAKFCFEDLKGRDHLKDLGVVGKIILEWVLGKLGGKGWTGFIWLRTGTSSRTL